VHAPRRRRCGAPSPPSQPAPRVRLTLPAAAATRGETGAARCAESERTLHPFPPPSHPFVCTAHARHPPACARSPCGAAC
jgi:hypothetical protein